jgi:predicted DNA-binding protein
MLSCKEAAWLISESMDRDLPLMQRLGIRAHLLMCKHCTRYRRQLLFIRDAIQHYLDEIENEESLPPVSLSPEALERINAYLSKKP